MSGILLGKSAILLLYNLVLHFQGLQIYRWIATNLMQIKRQQNASHIGGKFNER
jgi:hypothetical protein